MNCQIFHEKCQLSLHSLHRQVVLCGAIHLYDDPASQPGLPPVAGRPTSITTSPPPPPGISWYAAYVMLYPPTAPDISWYIAYVMLYPPPPAGIFWYAACHVITSTSSRYILVCCLLRYTHRQQQVYLGMLPVKYTHHQQQVYPGMLPMSRYTRVNSNSQAGSIPPLVAGYVTLYPAAAVYQAGVQLSFLPPVPGE